MKYQQRSCKTSKINYMNLLDRAWQKEGYMVSLSGENLKWLMSKAWRLISLCLGSTAISNRIRLLNNWTRFLVKMTKNHGPNFTVKYLKACQMAIMKKVAGTPFSSLRELEPDLPLPRLSTSGLPHFLSKQDRNNICAGSGKIIQLWISLLGIYRVLKVPSKPKLSTISDPFIGDPEILELVSKFLGWYAPKRWVIHHADKKVSDGRLLPLKTSSPSAKISWMGWYADMQSILLTDSLSDALLLFLRLTKNDRLLKQFESGLQVRDAYNHYQDNSKSTWISGQDVEYRTNKKFVPICMNTSRVVVRWANDLVDHLGKLSFKIEPAGKVRVFAMVDVWTQSALKPLHDCLFRFLKTLPNDGTFDQEASFKRAKEKAVEFGCSFGYDLSAATDRLPLSLQIQILNSVFGEGVGTSWGTLLVDRDYVISSRDQERFHLDTPSLRYKVGQPMGALSSWAMLAITHHFIVQFCARKVGVTRGSDWFGAYELLGDDIVLFDAKVADLYSRVMHALGVSINKSKSVLSPNKPVVEFTKRFSVGTLELSPYSFRHIINCDNFFGRLELSIRSLRRGHPSAFSQWLIANRESRLMRTRMVKPMLGLLSHLVERGLLDLDLLIANVLDPDKPMTLVASNLGLSPFKQRHIILQYIRSVDKDFSHYFDSIESQGEYFDDQDSLYRSLIIHHIIRLQDRYVDLVSAIPAPGYKSDESIAAQTLDRFISYQWGYNNTTKVIDNQYVGTSLDHLPERFKNRLRIFFMEAFYPMSFKKADHILCRFSIDLAEASLHNLFKELAFWKQQIAEQECLEIPKFAEKGKVEVKTDSLYLLDVVSKARRMSYAQIMEVMKFVFNSSAYNSGQ